MANEPVMTIVGNLTEDPTLRFTTSGAAVVNFTIAQTPRRFDKPQNQWVDEETIFMRCTAWQHLAENIAGTLAKGQQAIVVGRLQARSWTAQDGQERTSWELQVDEAGPGLRWATATVTKSTGNQAGQPQQQGQPQQGYGQHPQSQPQQSPWAGNQQQNTWGNQPQETPF